ncbi:MAG: UDP-N-acetylmuramate dehydrogenase [Acidobacteria bacterium]|uniref:UDP-N-acetylenolpyruvoylglucosamine reductase n=1 Tax=Candidatus Polarisedimenticola svalbardensis TaxID=2886004 RepID=A0A8J6XY23_9BACT|nr:UDP-N-acetylmuramate dehydrogenase [Candidatus Polarisedimenticola svalbardensis]
MFESLRQTGFCGEIEAEAALAPLTTWRIGGPAELLASPADEDDLARALAWADGEGVPWRVLGNGSNLLVSDQGVRGLVLRIRRVLDQLEFDGTTARAGAGLSFPALANACASRGLAGLEFAGGIPGTVGGAVIMNAGWHEHEFGNRVTEVRWLDAGGTVHSFNRKECRFGYRTSRFRSDRGVVVAATIQLEEGESGRIRSQTDMFVDSRKTNQPTHLPSCGSVFLKPPGDFAGRLIDACGLKGRRVGDIQVSPMHANFFVNLGRGSADNVLELVAEVERQVRDQFGVDLVREFEYWGGEEPSVRGDQVPDLLDE